MIEDLCVAAGINRSDVMEIDIQPGSISFRYLLRDKDCVCYPAGNDLAHAIRIHPIDWEAERPPSRAPTAPAATPSDNGD